MPGKQEGSMTTGHASVEWSSVLASPKAAICPLLMVHQEALQAREPGTVLECLPGLVLAFLHRVPTMSHSVNVTTRPEWGAVHQWPRGGCLTPDSTS